MSESQRILLLVGSARRPRSTSEAMGAYLLEQMADRGWDSETLLLHRVLGKAEQQETLFHEVDQADVIVLAFPLYVDSLPANAIRALELIHERRRAGPHRREQKLLAIVNSGFPEAHQSDTAIAICRQFAREAGLEFAGGLRLGGGGAINGRPIEEVGGAARFVVAALDMAAEAIAAGHPIPEEAVETMGTSVVPAWGYRWMGWLGWRLQARQNGVLRQLYAKPYEA